MTVRHQILVVDDELSMRELLDIMLSNAGYDVQTAENVAAAQEKLRDQGFDVVLTDLRMGSDRNAGMTLLEWINEHAPTTPAIMITAHGSVDNAIEAVKRGAADYVMKPFKNEEIRLLVHRTIEQRDLRRQNEALRKEQAAHVEIERMISPGFQEVLTLVRRVAKLPSTVAIHGESGVGKEVVARTLHDMSDRADKPFVAINCGGIPETLLESELWGHKKGAFTGAIADKEGLFVIANGGTVFLDEIGEMPLVLQTKLLRVLDNHTITPVGATSEMKVDIRLVSATNRDLERMSDEGKFRSDLYYRLNVIPIVVPPLRERPDDIPLFVRHFVKKHAASMSRPAPEISPEAIAAFRAYRWPGNVRELGNALERVVALCSGDRIEVQDLPPNLREPAGGDAAPTLAPAQETSLPPEGVDLEQLVADLEIRMITQALEIAKYSQKRAAQLLGLTPRSLRYRLQKYELESH